MAEPPTKLSRSPARTLLTVGAVAVALFLVLFVVVLATPSGPSSSSPPPSTSGVLSHTGVANNDTPVTTAPISVTAGCLVVVFVGYVNYLAGGGSVASLGDSLSDSYTLVTSTGFAYNHTESVWVTETTVASTSFVVSALIDGGATPQGGSVAVVVFAHATVNSIDGANWATGDGALASVALPVNHSGDWVVSGFTGRGVSGPFSPGSSQSLLDTGTATGGPFQDGVAYGTFVSTIASAGVASVSASLNVPTYWVAIAVAIR
ncbi:MAG TPA: hypothetical protein VEG42_00295 [Thermoplasmata archaeon]|nr:hypothetical protein [Thermoplasmata archaeon]